MELMVLYINFYTFLLPLVFLLLLAFLDNFIILVAINKIIASSV